MGGLLRHYIIVALMAFALLVPAAHAYYKDSIASNVTGIYSAEARYHSPILFIPGIGGTYLVDGNGDELWPGGLWYYGDQKQLAFQDDGVTPTINGAVVRATTPIRIAAIAHKRVVVYDGFYRWMDENTSYTFRGRQGAYLGGRGRAYFDHPYDFRLPNERQIEDVENSTKKKVDELLSATTSDKIIIVAHSMGGYQARLFAEKYPGKVKAIIFLSTPHHGAPRVLYALTEGYNLGAEHTYNETFWGFAKNWPGAYELLPDEPFVRDGNGNWTLEQTFYGDWVSKQALDHYQKERWSNVSGQENAEEILRRELPRGLNSHQVARKMQEFRKRFNAITLDKKIRVELINGDNQPGTMFEHVANPTEGTLTSGTWPFSKTQKIPYPFMRFDPQREAKGDLTVSWKGLQWEGHHTQTVNDEHGNVPNNQTALRMMMGVVEEINHDKRDDGWLQRINGTAESYLMQLRDKEAARKQAEAYAEKIKEIEKQKGAGREINEGLLKRLKGDLEGRARKFVFGDLIEGKTYRVNIVVPDAGQYDEENKDFHAWVVIDNMKLIDSGIGTVRPSDVTVTVKSRGMDVLEGRVSPGDAWNQGFIDVNMGLFQDGLIKAARLAQKLLEE